MDSDSSACSSRLDSTVSSCSDGVQAPFVRNGIFDFDVLSTPSKCGSQKGYIGDLSPISALALSSVVCGTPFGKACPSTSASPSSARTAELPDRCCGGCPAAAPTPPGLVPRPARAATVSPCRAGASTTPSSITEPQPSDGSADLQTPPRTTAPPVFSPSPERCGGVRCERRAAQPEWRVATPPAAVLRTPRPTPQPPQSPPVRSPIRVHSPTALALRTPSPSALRKRGRPDCETPPRSVTFREPVAEVSPDPCRKLKPGAAGAPPQWTPTDFDFGRQLGTGATAAVHLARERSTKFVCAIKIVNRQDLCDRYRARQLWNEIDTQRRQRHRNIVKLYSYFYDADAFYLCMEYCCGGSLTRVLRDSGPLSESSAAKYVAQICSAVQYLHHRGVIHRDIKPENVMLSASGSAKLGDFGCSVRLPPGAPPRETFCGTWGYMAPEVLAGYASRKGAGRSARPEQGPRVQYTPAADMWALGALTHELLTGSPPHDHCSPRAAEREARQYSPPSHFSEAAADFARRLLTPDVGLRLNIDQAVHHPFVVGR
eukprot:TRINITY_DN420_c3_g2_i2.p1 TRINITY_DN420_c3_g2~~TRINITY_DN420_c3_g2_i2.p1  ORF type:complete len:562 (+),score=92.83 TRINITY_DN420_c3_g2_i2:56-1687(+)